MGLLKRTLFLVALTAALLIPGNCYDHEDDDWDWDVKREGDWFLLHDSKRVVKTDAGDVRVVRGFGSRYMHSPMHIGFITMEPRSLFIPQYLDSGLILFLRSGEARVGHIYKDQFVEKDLKSGDIYRLEEGSAFYIENLAEGEKLHIICSIDTSQSLGWHMIQAFYIGGGTNPTSVLSGFDRSTMSAAFNVAEAELSDMFTRQRQGPIVHLSGSHSPTVWSKFSDMTRNQKSLHMKSVLQITKDALALDEDEEETKKTWSIRKLLVSVFGNGNRGENKHGLDSYNLYDRKPDFENNYGWSIALDESEYSPLKHDDIGVYLVNLTAGSMMAPHVNPRATEYGIVLRGSGTIQIVFPNGTLAMNVEVKEGDVFWVPRYFAFCQISSRAGPLEFFGFTTSARNNRPQFLVGANSLLQTMRGPEFAESFGMSEEWMNKIVNAQRESSILPSAAVAPPDEADKVVAI